VLVIYIGVTRATRIAKLAPGSMVRVEVIGRLRKTYANEPKIGDLLAMISSVQREALAVLVELVDMSDDVRLGQLLAHLGFLGQDQTGRTLWDIDDEQLLAVLYHHRGELKGRLSSVPPQSLDFAAGAPTGSTVDSVRQ